MKKVTAIILAAVLVLAFSACASDEPQLELRSYSYEGDTSLESDFIETSPELYFGEDYKCSFSYSPLISYMDTGSYEIKDNMLIMSLHTQNTDNAKLVLEIKSDVLIYNAELSEGFEFLPDGAEFR